MTTIDDFKQLGLPSNLLKALCDLGYETPSPIQAKSIPVLLQGDDLLAQAQTGTGKTAAFALPILTKIELENMRPQALVLTPTRELAIQVSEAFRAYAKYIKDLHVLPIYGGQDYRTQLKALERGVHVVVGTPGRVMDHLRRGTFKTDALQILVLDEADEMLNMGFLEDVKWILEQIPNEHQTALFSATVPSSIRKIATDYLKNKQEIRINPTATTVESIKQTYMLVANNHKLEALTRYLEVEDFDSIIIFTRTKIASSELAEKLEARGYAAAAMNGDMSQPLREKVIKRIKENRLDIIVATEVAARGLDIDRISHVISYDIPYDTDAYIHRIGRTGRAGREGKALVFVTPRERRMLREIEQAVRKPLESINPPSAAEINEKRIKNFTLDILHTLANDDLDYYRELIEHIAHTSESSELDIAAAIAKRFAKKEPDLEPINEKPLFEKERPQNKQRRRGSSSKPERFRRDFKSDSRNDFKSDFKSDSRNDFKSDFKSDKKFKGKKDDFKGKKDSFKSKKGNEFKKGTPKKRKPKS